MLRLGSRVVRNWIAIYVNPHVTPITVDSARRIEYIGVESIQKVDFARVKHCLEIFNLIRTNYCLTLVGNIVTEFASVQWLQFANALVIIQRTWRVAAGTDAGK